MGSLGQTSPESDGGTSSSCHFNDVATTSTRRDLASAFVPPAGGWRIHLAASNRPGLAQTGEHGVSCTFVPHPYDDADTAASHRPAKRS